jgi:hypothetical protein
MFFRKKPEKYMIRNHERIPIHYWNQHLLVTPVERKLMEEYEKFLKEKEDFSKSK